MPSSFTSYKLSILHEFRIYGGSGKPALLQISTLSAVVLVPLKHLGAQQPAALQQMLQSGLKGGARAILCGVGVAQDVGKVMPGSSAASSALSLDISIAAWRAGLIPSQAVSAPRESPSSVSGEESAGTSSQDEGDGVGGEPLPVGPANGQDAEIFYPTGTMPKFSGLGKTVAALGGPLLSKPKSVQMSNWEKRELTPAQARVSGA